MPSMSSMADVETWRRGEAHPAQLRPWSYPVNACSPPETTVTAGFGCLRDGGTSPWPCHLAGPSTKVQAKLIDLQKFSWVSRASAMGLVGTNLKLNSTRWINSGCG